MSCILPLSLASDFMFGLAEDFIRGLLSAWLLQVEILRRAKPALFVTHAGRTPRRGFRLAIRAAMKGFLGFYCRCFRGFPVQNQTDAQVRSPP